MIRQSVTRCPVVPAIALGLVVAHPLGAQSDRQDVVWQNSRMSVKQLSVEPGAPLPGGGDQILVHFTADAEGKVPAEAVWQSDGAQPVQNRGPRRLEALAIELKDAPESGARGTTPELLPGEGVTVTTLIDNPRVLVMKHRYGPMAFGARLHFHTEDVLLVYLRGGYAWPLDGSWVSARVQRGDVAVVPAHTFHTLANAGGDPLELLVIVPR